MKCYSCKRDTIALFDDGVCLECRNAIRAANKYRSEANR